MNAQDEVVTQASEILGSLCHGKDDEAQISIGEINTHLNQMGFAIIMIFFSITMAIPLPYPPGLTTILGMPLLLLSLQMIQGRNEPWLPNWVIKRTIKVGHVRLLIDKSLPWFKKAEKILTPRLLFVSGFFCEKMIGLVCLLCSICIVLPIWFGNAIPSAGILVMSFGLLGRDGVVILAGIVIGIIGIIISMAVVYLLGMGAAYSIPLFWDKISNLF